MAEQSYLDFDEIVLLKEDSVAHDGVMALYTDELILTNKKIICQHKGMLGGNKTTYFYPLYQLKAYNGEPQVKFGKLSNGIACLDLYLLNGEEHFTFSRRNKATIQKWIDEIRKIFCTVVSTKKGVSVDNNPFIAPFKEAGVMAYCTRCGAQLKYGARFCDVCGSMISNEPQIKKTGSNSLRKTFYDGAIHKCPNCGAVLNAFIKNCPACGYELRGVASTISVHEFSLYYEKASNNAQKADLIRTYAIPNTKEDILEFVILASSNIDPTSYTRGGIIVAGGTSQQELSEAWMAKLEQAYHKAALLLPRSQEYSRIEAIYNDKKKQLDNCRNKSGKRQSTEKTRSVLVIFLSFALLFLIGVGPLATARLSHTTKVHKLEKIVETVEQLIDAGDYDAALIKADQLYDDSGWSSESREKWDNIRESLIARIYKLQSEAQGKACIPDKDFTDKQYEDVVSQFQKAGFKNILTEKVPDLVTGWIHKEGEVIDVSINGTTSFSKGDYVDSDATVLIRYHGFKD